MSKKKRPDTVWLYGLTLLLLIVLTLMRFDLLSVWRSETLSSADIVHNGGNSYRVDFPAPLYSDEDQYPSLLEIYEDGTLLAKPHAVHQAIKTDGEGRFSHWGRMLFFAASDSSDPRINQRTYQVRYPWRPSSFMLFGVTVIALGLIGHRLGKKGLRRVSGCIVQLCHTAIYDNQWREHIWLSWLTVLLFVVLLVMRFGLFPLSVSEIISPANIFHDDGYSYRVAFNRSDYFDTGVQHPSRLEIYQDGTLLKKPHALHDAIRNFGEVRYSHWKSNVFFAASDNSDPRTSQHQYQLRYPWRPSEAILFGAALIALLFNIRRVRSSVIQLDSCHPGWLIGGLCLIALTYRIAVAIDLWHGSFNGMQIKGVPFSDAVDWYRRGVNFAYGQVVHPNTLSLDARRPGYCWFVGVLIKLFGEGQLATRIVQIVLSGLAAGLIFDLLRRVTARSVALLATFVYLFLLWDARSNVLIMSESIGYFLSNLALWWLVVTVVARNRLNTTLLYMVIAAALLAAANMVRPLNLLALPGLALMSGWLIARSPPPINWRRGVLVVAAMVLGATLVLAPWLVRQKIVYGFVALSDNSIEMLYATTSPTIQTWSSNVIQQAIADHPAVSESILGRYHYFQRGVADNLANHFGWFLEQVIRRSWDHAVAIALPAWLPALAAVLFLVSHDGSSRQQGRRRLWIASGAVVAAALLLPASIVSVVMTVGWLITTVWSVVRSQPIALLGLLLIPTLFTLGALIVVVSMRFDYTLLWLAAAMTLHGVWYGLARATGVTVEVPAVLVSDDQTTHRWQRAIGRALLVIIVAGAATMLTAQLYPRTVETAVLNESRSQRLIDHFVAGPEGAQFAPMKNRLRVYRTTLKDGFAMRFDRDEEFNYTSRLFAPRPYRYSAYYPFPPISNLVSSAIPVSCSDAHFVVPDDQAAEQLIYGQRYDFVGLCRTLESGEVSFEVVEIYQASTDSISRQLNDNEATRQHRQFIRSVFVKQ